MIGLFRTLPLALAAVVVSTVAGAEVVAPSFKQMTANGYEIKAVTLLQVPVLNTAGDAANTPKVVITLQKGASTAACVFGLTNWWNQLPASLEGTSQCSVYPPPQ